ncbi:TadE/TadG family type IV pilus assembly protein [Agrobacterium tumefaciens]|uniref:TadE/TadG family type IV pilus assembly protein n=1 Tax=Agrobacterium tumefaciens TaxID=358 RepID=UPI003B9E53DC
MIGKRLKYLSISLISSRSGVAAVELALLMPLLILVLAMVIEIGRGWMSYDRFVTVVDNTARWSARFPEFEERVRTGVKSFVIAAGRPLESEKLDLTLRSAKLVGGVAVTEFAPYNFFWQRRKREVGQDIDARKLQDRRSGNRNFGALQIPPAHFVAGQYGYRVRIRDGGKPVFLPTLQISEGKVGLAFLECSLTALVRVFTLANPVAFQR